MKKYVAALLSAVLLLNCLPFAAVANFNTQEEATKNLVSDIYYMTSMDDETVLFSKNETRKTAPAAFVKLFAAMVAIESWTDLDEKVEITGESLALVNYDYGVRTANLRPGESYTKRQLLETLIVYSANDVASVIAYTISETEQAFVALMNALAQKIGCTKTKLVNITGFDAEGQYSTAQDIEKLIKYANANPAFAQAFSASSVTLPATDYNSARTYNSENKMRSAAISDYYHASVTGGKTTSTSQAGECVAVTASQDGYTYLCIVMKGKLADVDRDGVNENTALTDAKQLIAWTYNNIRYSVIATTNQTVQVINVTAARDGDTLRLVPEKETRALVPSKATSSSVLIEPIADTMPKKLIAPVKQGEQICQARVMYAGEEITTINLVAANDVRLSVVRLFMTRLRSLLSSTPFILLEAAGLVILLLYIALLLLKYKKPNKPQLRRVEGGKSRQNNKD